MKKHDDNSEILTASQRLDRIRSYTAPNPGNPTAHYPVPAEWIGWLLRAYATLQDAHEATSSRKFVAKPFAEMDNVTKLTMIYREVEGANTSGLPTLTVPSSWVTWLLAEYDDKVVHSKAKAILGATKNGQLLSPRDLEIVQLATAGGLSSKGFDEFDALHNNVVSGEYLDPSSPHYPWFHGIKHLTQDHDGAVFWKGQEIGHRPTCREGYPSEVTVVRALACECVRAEQAGLPLPTRAPESATA